VCIPDYNNQEDKQLKQEIQAKTRVSKTKSIFFKRFSGHCVQKNKPGLFVMKWKYFNHIYLMVKIGSVFLSIQI